MWEIKISIQMDPEKYYKWRFCIKIHSISTEIVSLSNFYGKNQI